MTVDTIETRIIRASEGYFLANYDMTLYGYEIYLGKYDSPENYTEHPISEWPIEPVIEEPNDGQQEPIPYDEDMEPIETEENEVPDQLAVLKASKLRDIEAYDISPNVNGFLFNGNIMWLDRETRSSLRNTIESATLVGRTELDIWFGDVYITLPLEQAKMMLAVLEVYATDCYNVTAQHKVALRAIDNIEGVTAFDVTDGYPEMPSFSSLTEE